MRQTRIDPPLPVKRPRKSPAPDTTSLGQLGIGRGILNKAGRPAEEGRRITLITLYEAEFGVRPAGFILGRHLSDLNPDPIAIRLAQTLVSAVGTHRVALDAKLTKLAPRHPLTTLSKLDRVLLRAALAERSYVGGSAPAVATAAWTAIARAYGGDASRRLVAGVLGALVKPE